MNKLAILVFKKNICSEAPFRNPSGEYALIVGAIRF